ncbi:MAG: AsmA family protein [Candidatus Zixiibacteriota bacterium]
MKKFLKILAWIAGAIVLLLIVLVIAAKLFFPVDKAKAYAIEKGSTTLGRPIDIQEVKVSFWGGLGVRLDNVSIGNPDGFGGDPFLNAEYVDVKLRLLPLLSKQVAIDRFIINRAHVSMLKLADGSNNYTFGTVDSALPVEAQAMPAETKAAAAAVSFDKLEIREGQLQYRNDSSNLTVTLENVDLNTALENPRPGVYMSSGRLRIDSVRVKTVQPVPVVSAGLNYRASYDLNRKYLTLEKADFDISGLRLNLSGDLSHDASGIKGRAALKTESIAAVDALRLMPKERFEMLQQFRVSGDFAVDVSVDYDAARTARPLHYAGTAVMTDLTLSRKDIMGELKIKRAVIDGKPDTVRLSVQEGTFNGKPLRSTIVLTNFVDPFVNGNLAGYVDFVFLKPFLPAPDMHELTGEARLDIKFVGRVKDPKNLDIAGDIEVDRGSYNSRFMPERLDTFLFDAFVDKKVVSVRKLSAKSKSADLAFTGRIDNLLAWVMADSIAAREIHPGLDGRLTGKVNLAVLNSFLPAKRHPSLAGQVGLDVSVVGSVGELEKIRPRGKVTVANGAYNDSLLPEPVKRFDAELIVSPDTITVSNLAVQFESSDASFTGRLSKPFPYLLPLKTVDRSKLVKPFFSFQLTSRRFDSDKLFPEAVPGSGAINPAMPIDSLPSIIVPDIDGAGSFAIDTLVYSKIEFTNIKGKVKVYDRKIEVYDATGKAYTGAVAGKTVIDLNDFENPRYVGEFTATQIEANDFVSRFSPFGGYLFGKFDVNGHYDATGWEPEQFQQTLTMNGLGTVQDGKLVTSGILYNALAGIAQKAGRTFNKEQPLKGLTSKITIKDGKVMLDGLKTTLGDLGDLELGGFYGFNGDIGYSGSIFLSREMTQGLTAQGGLLAGLANALSDTRTQRLRLPLKITGTIDHPNAELDMAAVSKSATDKLKQDAGSLLEGLIKKPEKK